MKDTGALMGCGLFAAVIFGIIALIVSVFAKRKKVREYMDSLARNSSYEVIAVLNPEYDVVRNLIISAFSRLSQFNITVSNIIRKEYEDFTFFLVSLSAISTTHSSRNTGEQISVLIRMNTGLKKGFFIRKKLPGFAENIIASFMGRPAVIPHALPQFNEKFAVNKGDQTEIIFISSDLQNRLVSLYESYPFKTKPGSYSSSDFSGISFFPEGVFICGNDILDPKLIDELIETALKIAESTKAAIDGYVMNPATTDVSQATTEQMPAPADKTDTDDDEEIFMPDI